jgi:hypothetical protein
MFLLQERESPEKIVTNKYVTLLCILWYRMCTLPKDFSRFKQEQEQEQTARVWFK